MARLFAAASTQYLVHGAGVVTTYPFTMGCWFNTSVNTNGVEQCLMSLTNSGAANSYHFMELRGSGDVLVAVSRLAAATGTATASASYSINTWSHGCGVFTSATSRAVYLNGGNVGANTTNATPSSINTTAIGRVQTSSPFSPMSGMLAEAAIWNVALTAEEVAILAKGYSPLFIRPVNLVSYWPITGRMSPEIDSIGRFDMTPTNTPVQAAHPRIIYPWNQRIAFPSSGGAPPDPEGNLYFRRIGRESYGLKGVRIH